MLAYYVNGITFDKVMSHPEPIIRGLGSTQKKAKVDITCFDIRGRDSKESKLHDIYTDIAKGGEKLKGVLADGKEYLNLPLVIISNPLVKCYALPSQCEERLYAYVQSIPFEYRETEVPHLLNQIIRGVAYLHRAGRTHGDINSFGK
ncbi:hypothetical protein BDF22DRAFT_654605 [Syncephalis plumigaleata]|nr:hypothetical protein BDF22DRAFT_654605 [Syncephalis plumigaleata]